MGKKSCGKNPKGRGWVNLTRNEPKEKKGSLKAKRKKKKNRRRRIEMAIGGLVAF